MFFQARMLITKLLINLTVEAFPDILTKAAPSHTPPTLVYYIASLSFTALSTISNCPVVFKMIENRSSSHWKGPVSPSRHSLQDLWPLSTQYGTWRCASAQAQNRKILTASTPCLLEHSLGPLSHCVVNPTTPKPPRWRGHLKALTPVPAITTKHVTETVVVALPNQNMCHLYHCHVEKKNCLAEPCPNTDQQISESNGCIKFWDDNQNYTVGLLFLPRRRETMRAGPFSLVPTSTPWSNI